MALRNRIVESMALPPVPITNVGDNMANGLLAVVVVSSSTDNGR